MPKNSQPIILSANTVIPILNAIKNNSNKCVLSTDLGLSHIEVIITQDTVRLPNGLKLDVNFFNEIYEQPESCFEVNQSEISKIATYSEFTNRYISLYPTDSAPTMLLSGIPMHRIKDTNPYLDTLSKIKAVQPNGLVLDTTMGLGYTAIESARTADRVITIELDPAVLDLCRFNPWSKNLFVNPRISIVNGDSYDLIQSFPDNTFSRIIHDPPTFSLAGDLYSGFFYSQAFRILKPNGRFFHYIGDPNSSSGRRVTKGVVARMKSVGFKNISIRAEAFGLTANKR